MTKAIGLRDLFREGPLKVILTRPVVAAVVLLVATLVVAPFYLSRSEIGADGHRNWRLISTHDLPNYVPMMSQFDKVLRSGDIYPRWNPDFNKGYGTATANFYPPGTFYTTSLINSVVDNWTITLFILSALSLAASGFTFYWLSRAFYNKAASAFGALLYMLLPFHQMDLYWRGGIPQFVGYAFMPLVLYFAYRLGNEGRPRYYAALGGVHGLYLLSHIPVGYLFTYVVAAYAVIWALRSKNLRIALRIAGGLAISLLVSAIYWLPAALEGKYAYEWATEVFPYHYVYVSLMPSADVFTQHIQEIFTHNALALIATIVILRKLRPTVTSNSVLPASFDESRVTLNVESQTRIWIILGILMPFMTTSFSIHISKLIPRIQIATPPFRWLAIACLFTSLLVAASIDVLVRHQGLGKRQRLAYKLLLGAIVALNLWLTGHGIIYGALSNPTYVPPADFVDGGFTPKGSTPPDKLPDSAPVVITPEGGESEVLKWAPTHREIAVRVDQPSEVRIKTYNFHGWTARIDGNVVPLLSDKDGVQRITVPPGIHNVQTDFENTPPRTAGAVISALGGLLILGLSIAGTSRRREMKAEGRDQDPVPQTSFDNEVTGGAASVSNTRLSRISPLIRLTAIALVIIIGIAVVLMTTRNSNDGQTDGHGSTVSPSTPRSDQPVSGGARGAGSDAQLYIEGRTSILVAIDEKASDEMVSAISMRDQPALDALIASGRVLNASNNTRVRVLQSVSGRTKVRILDGPHVMAEGWVPERWLR